MDNRDGSVDNVPFEVLRNKVGVSQIELDNPEKPPVADDYMYDFKYNHELPTVDTLGVEIPAHCDAHKEACSIMARLEAVMGDGDAQGFSDMFLEHGASTSSQIKAVSVYLT